MNPIISSIKPIMLMMRSPTYFQRMNPIAINTAPIMTSVGITSAISDSNISYLRFS